jgi:hypothetical protein
LIIERFANISDGTVVGIRAPFLRVGGNEQFDMMTDQYFAYDSSITAPLSRVPIWPYTLQYRCRRFVQYSSMLESPGCRTSATETLVTVRAGATPSGR